MATLLYHSFRLKSSGGMMIYVDPYAGKGMTFRRISFW